MVKILCFILLCSSLYAQQMGSPVPIACTGGQKIYSLNTEGQFICSDPAVTSVFTRTGAVVAATNDYTWAQINKATSSLLDITTRSATDLSSGTLPDARLSANVSLLGSTIGGAELDNPAVGTKGGVEALTCSGNDKISAINTSGVPVCSTDQTSAGGATNLRVVTSDYTNSTTSFTDVTGLTMAVSNATTYTFVCHLMVLSAATTTGVQVSVNGPTTSSLFYSSEYFTAATAKATWTATTYDATSASTGTYPVNSAGSTHTLFQIQGHLVTTAAGTLAIRARSEVGTSLITIKVGSTCTVF